MTSPVQHTDVGAYALGILGEEEAARFEEHLAGCAVCGEELEQLMGVTQLLAEVPPGSAAAQAVSARPDPGLLDRTLEDLAASRRAGRRRRLGLVAAAAALIIGGPVVTAALVGGDSGSQGRPSAHATAPAKEAFLHGGLDKSSATDPDTRVEATVGTERKTWGTHAVMELKNVEGPLECGLIAVGKDGQEQTIGTWSVPAAGYGAGGEGAVKEPLYIHGGAAMQPNEIDHFEVRTFDGKRLVTVEAKA